MRLCLVLLLAVLRTSAGDSAGLFGFNNLPSIHWPFSQGHSQRRSDDKMVVFRLYTRNTMDNPEVVGSNQLVAFKNLDPKKPTKITIHGWRGYSNCTFTRSFRAAYLPLKDINLISVDWSGHGSRGSFYPQVRSQVPAVGKIVADYLDLLASHKKITSGNLHIIGHSLGAHVAGVAGKLFRKFKIPRITGLDPAGPQFYEKDVDGRLSSESAEFVDVIHTTANFLGYGDPLGHVDFYPNGGHAVQPGCGVDVTGICSHRRVYSLYIETIAHPDSFPAVSCESYTSFETNSCNSSDVIFMGEKTPKTARGKYYMQTNPIQPFAKKYAGTFYSKH